MKNKYTRIPILTILLAIAGIIRCYAQPTEMGWKVTALNKPEPGYLQFDCIEYMGFSVIDNYSRPMFMDSSRIMYFNQAKDGSWISISDNYKIYDREMRLLDSIPFVSRTGMRPDFHEFIKLSNGHYLMLYVEEFTKDMSKIVLGGKVDATIISDVLIESDPTGKIYWEWHAKDRLNVTDVADEIDLYQNTIDFSHANSFCEDAAGNIYVSFRHLDAITKIKKSTGEIMWSFGGSKSKRNQFAIMNDEVNGFKGFSHQHSVSVLPNGNLLIFDNGNLKPNTYSRAVEYQIDEIGKTATKVWEYVSSPLTYAVALGSAYRLPNGNTLINWATGRITEVTPSGGIALELSSTAGKTVYRAYKTLLHMNAVTRNITSSSQYVFNDSIYTTGVTLNVGSAPSYGTISVAKHNYPPPDAEYKDSSFTYIYPARWVITDIGLDNFQARLKLKVSDFIGVRNPTKLKFYSRNQEAKGVFKELATTYNESEQSIEANISWGGEFVVAVYELGPPALTAPANGKSCVPTNATFTWNAAPNATKYRLQAAKNANFTNLVADNTITGSVDFTVQGLENDTKYYWRACSINDYEISEWSDVRSFRTELSAPEPMKPENKTVGVKRGDMLEWRPSAGATHYRLQISNKNDFTNIVAEFKDITQTQLAFPNLNFNTKFHWRVKGYRGVDSSRWSASSELTTNLEAPTISSPDTNAINVAVKGIFQWSGVKGAESYLLQLSTSKDFSDLITDAKNITAANYAYSELSYNTQYYWRVKAKRSTDESEWSAGGAFVTKLEAPKLKVPKQDATVKVYDITLWWEAPEGAKRYRLQVSRSKEFKDTILYLSSVYYPAFTLSEAPANSQIYWRVKAYNDAKISDWSEVGAFSTTGAPGLAAPELLLPENDAETDNYGSLTWTKISRTNFYRAQISETPDFSELVLDSAAYMFNWRDYSKLRSSHRYFWRVKGYSYYDSSAWSATRSFTTKALSAVKLISPANDDARAPIPTKFIWEAMAGAKGYELQVAENDTFGTTSAEAKISAGTEWEIANLKRFTQYYWRVRLTTELEPGPWSIVRSFTTAPEDSIQVPEPSYPHNFNGGVPVVGIIKWRPVQGAKSYRVSISDDPLFNNIAFKEANVADTLISYSGLENNNMYFWRVSAVGENSESGWSPTHAFFTELRMPELIEPANRSEGVKTEGGLSWTDLPDVDNYYVQISPDSTFKTGVIFSKEFEPEFHYSLGADSVYYWRVASSNFGNYSRWTQAFSFRTAPVTSVGEDAYGKPAQLYPNPATDYVQINGEKYLNKSYDIYDIAGRPMARGFISSPRLDVSTLPSGAYYVQIEGDYFKVIKM